LGQTEITLIGSGFRPPLDIRINGLPCPTIFPSVADIGLFTEARCTLSPGFGSFTSTCAFLLSLLLVLSVSLSMVCFHSFVFSFSTAGVGLSISPVANFLSYSAPNITELIGCGGFGQILDPTTKELSLFNCSRSGNETITLIGNNFGASKARVRIGQFCSFLTLKKPCQRMFLSSSLPYSIFPCSSPVFFLVSKVPLRVRMSFTTR
jgi:hypothetical protein